MKKILNHLRSDWYKYALELIVITAGILGAFALNNWNESRSIKIKEVNMLQELAAGIASDVADMRVNFAFHQEALNSQNVLIEWLANDHDYTDSLAMHISTSFRTTSFISNDGAYETMKSIGMDLISNEHLREELVGYYDKSFEGYAALEIYQDELRMQIRENFQTLFDQYQVYDITKESYKGAMKPNNPTSLKENSVFSYWLNTQKESTVWLTRLGINQVISNGEQLLEHINEEIQTLEQ